MNTYTRNARARRAALSACLTLLLMATSACSTREGARRSWPAEDPGTVGTPLPPAAPEPAPVEPLPEAEVEPLPDHPRSAEEISGAAVTSLMRQARAALDAGRADRAAAALERALRIEPRNYFVWAMLGRTYLAQSNYAQADAIATKSNALAHGNVYAELENWRTIAAARAALGDAAAAQAAQQRVLELEQWLQAGSPPSAPQ